MNKPLVTHQKFLVFDETQQSWVAEHGFCTSTLNALSFDTPNEVYNHCRQRRDMVGHFINVVLFFNRQCINHGLTT